MIKLMLGYNGIPMQTKEFPTEAGLIAFIDTLRPAQNRPAHLIVESNNIPLITHITEMLYAAQIFALWDMKLYGGMDYTRRFLAVHNHWQNGGRIDDIPKTKFSTETLILDKYMIEIDSQFVEIEKTKVKGGDYNILFSHEEFDKIIEKYQKMKSG